MSGPLTSLPNPFPSTSPITFVTVPNVRFHLWSYRALRSLQSNLSSGQLIHQPYNHPVSTIDQGYTHPPPLFGADHVFEWHSLLHRFPLCIVTLSINPLFRFPHPQLIISNSFSYQCPHLHPLHWDLTVRADLGGHLKYSRRWSGVRAGVLLGAQGAVHRGENRGGL